MLFNYLGTFVSGKQVPMIYFNSLLSKIRTKVNSWKSNLLLPLVAQKVQLQSVLTTIPRFILPNSRLFKVALGNLHKKFHCFLWCKSDGCWSLLLVS